MISKLKEGLKKIPFAVMVYEKYAERFRIPLDAIRRYRVFCYGNKNKDKKFFLITFKPGGRETMYSKMGIYSLTLCFVMPFVDFAIKKGWTPVVDLRGDYVPLLQDADSMETENAWECYYEQPIMGISLEEVYQSRYVLNGWYWRHEIKWYEWDKMFSDLAGTLEQSRWENNADEIFLKKKSELEYWNKIITSYIRLNENIKSRLAVEYNKIFQPNHKTLGVGIRAGLRAGMMRNESLYNDHPKQPTCEELMDIVEEKMKIWGCGILFVSCDDREYLDKFIARFGEKCRYMERKRVHYFKDDRPVVEDEEIVVERKGSSTRECVEEYVIETHLLAQCDCLYSCIGGGAEFAFFLNGGQYEYVEVYDQGVYEGLGKEA